MLGDVCEGSPTCWLYYNEHKKWNKHFSTTLTLVPAYIVTFRPFLTMDKIARDSTM